jgi:hypothetical protein
VEPFNRFECAESNGSTDREQRDVPYSIADGGSSRCSLSGIMFRFDSLQVYKGVRIKIA